MIARILAAAAAALALAALPAAASTPARSLDPGTRFFVPSPDAAAVRQTLDLVRAGDVQGALRLGALLAQGHAVWFTGGTPQQVRKGVARTMAAARLERRVPVLVAYDVPNRDCSQYSAGGAADTASYLAWIDGFARGLGGGQAVVILEPDGLGLLPGGACPGSVDDRYAQLNGAVDRLERQPGALVYLDGTHSNWLSVGDVASRLVQAGVLRAQGFFLDVSNYEETSHLAKYGTWIAKCIAFANDPEEGGWRLGHYDWCASQYYPANPADFSTWGLTDAWYDANLGTAAPTAHFVVDTSRNGQGPWTPPAGKYAGDPQTWCNPPGRGAGARPTADTGVPLLDAYLWVKVPGESDGSCTRGTAGPEDPEWGLVDPAAGAWFPQQALQLANLASPPLLPR